MKIIDTKDNKIVVNFNKDELEILTRVIDVPLGAFGKERLLSETKVNLDKILTVSEKLHSAITSSTHEVSFSSEELDSFKRIFDVSCEIIDPNEMHILTGFTWKEAMKISDDLKVIIDKIKTFD